MTNFASQLVTVIFLLAISGNASQLQRRALPPEQAALESIAAQHWIAEMSGEARARLSNWLLDGRHYSIPIPFFDDDATLPRRVASELPDRSTVPNHVQSLASSLGVAAVVTGESSCIPDTGNAICRLGDKEGLIAFATAAVYPDSAVIRMFFWSKVDGENRTWATVHQYHMSRRDTAWVVREVRRITS
jgi:hypothetical protein